MVQSKVLTTAILGYTCNQAYCDTVFQDVYELQGTLGEGTFGAVRACEHRKSKKRLAVKIMDRNMDTYWTGENAILAKIRTSGGHRHIMDYKEAIKEEGKTFIVMELINGLSLFDYMQKHWKMKNRQASVHMIGQLADAVCFLHENHIVHGDIKPDNIMVENGTTKIKLIDFGSAVLTGDAKDVVVSGTKCYWPPEMVVAETPIANSSADMWAIGCILFILCTGRHPFDQRGCSSVSTILENIRQHQHISFPIGSNVPAPIQEIIQQLLALDPMDRPSADELANVLYCIEIDTCF